VPASSPEEVGQPNVLFDVSDATEVLASGSLKGAVNVSRGMLEFRADEIAPYNDRLRVVFSWRGNEGRRRAKRAVFLRWMPDRVTPLRRARSGMTGV